MTTMDVSPTMKCPHCKKPMVKMEDQMTDDTSKRMSVDTDFTLKFKTPIEVKDTKKCYNEIHFPIFN